MTQEPKAGPTHGWTAADHIEEACRLLDVHHARRGKGGGYVITPVHLTEAQVNIDIAMAKMTGRLRA